MTELTLKDQADILRRTHSEEELILLIKQGMLVGDHSTHHYPEGVVVYPERGDPSKPEQFGSTRWDA